MKTLIFVSFCVILALADEIPENGIEINSKAVRRQIPAYAAPLYAAPSYYAPPAIPAAPPAVLAAPVAYQPPPPPPPPPACAPACIGGAACVAGVCACQTPAIAYNPVVGCAPPLPPPPAPVVSGRLIPQALPGAPCEPGVECTGGSVCSMGICLCPPELVQEGTVCVSRTIYGVVPPPVPIAPAPVALAPGAPCIAAAPIPTCAPGAFCDPRANVCTCGPAYTPVGPSCIRRRLARKQNKSDKE